MGSISQNPFTPSRRRFLNVSLFALTLVVVVLNLYASLPRAGLYKDWGSFVESGRAVNAGRNPYADYALTNYAIVRGQKVYGPNYNPPTSLPLFQLIALFNPDTSFQIWFVLNSILYLFGIYLIARAFPSSITLERFLFTLTFVGLWQTLENGQIYVLQLLIVIGAVLLFARRQDAWGGLLIGIAIAVKPNFAVWPILLWLAGHRRAALTSVTTAALLYFISFAIYGPTIYMEWLAVVPRVVYGVPTNISLMNVSGLLGLPQLGVPLAAILLGVLAFWSRRTRPPALAQSGPAVLASLLSAPSAWLGVSVMLLPFFFIGQPNRGLRLSMILFSIPSLLVYAVPGLWLIYPVAALLALYGTVQPFPFLRMLNWPRTDIRTDRPAAPQQGAT